MLTKNVQMQLIKRDRTPGSPTFGQDLDILEVYGPDANEGACLLGNFSGLMHAPRTHVKDTWAYQEGVTLSDFPRVDERVIDLKIATKGLTSDDWEELEKRLWGILTFKEDAVLRLTTPNASREMNIRLERKPDDGMQYWPGETKHMIWNLVLLAADPWWYGDTLTSKWTRGAAVADGQGWYSGTVELFNPADQECWIEFANGEITTAETWTLPDAGRKYPIGHASAGQFVTHTLPQLGVGKSFLVQTHPLKETLMVMDNSQEWAKMRAEDFVYSLPPNMTAPIVAPVKLKGGTASSTIEVFMTQRYDRPWG
ncbi:minor tail protein [Gordonia phage Forza]|uniref:Minor tail protein n=1 Tax=Gordonia phage Forza TaxID=2571247 RepID=A0A650EYD4_9CAUD|nr:minor tail protein [Gordonia phage Forza]QEM41567.1 minor tail protein [Gordonia phage Boopy]QGT55093.1 minor tail protein [Gordonia phage Forza]UXE04241.1 minor tail protein [Gordonia phage BlueNGold]WBF03881.1 minor tail protein [Gordonia phage Mareelih]